MISHALAQYFTLFSYIGFFVLGKYLYDYVKKNDLRKYNILLIVSMIVCFTVSIILNYTSSMKYNMFYNLYFAYRTPFIIISSFAFYTLIISNYRKDDLDKIIMKLSDLSLGVYLIHGIFLDITVKIFLYPSVSAFIGIPLFTFIIFICSITSTYILKKIKIVNYIVN